MILLKDLNIIFRQENGLDNKGEISRGGTRNSRDKALFIGMLGHQI
jgi:hypothetical protein